MYDGHVVAGTKENRETGTYMHTYICICVAFQVVQCKTQECSLMFPLMIFGMAHKSSGLDSVGRIRGYCSGLLRLYFQIDTPNFESLVKRGLLLNRHYVYTFCSPTRSSLISGRLPVHVNDVNLDPTFYNPEDPVSGYAAIPRNMTGIAEKMKMGGYKTHQVG